MHEIAQRQNEGSNVKANIGDTTGRRTYEHSREKGGKGSLDTH